MGLVCKMWYLWYRETCKLSHHLEGSKVLERRRPGTRSWRKSRMWGTSVCVCRSTRTDDLGWQSGINLFTVDVILRLCLHKNASYSMTCGKPSVWRNPQILFFMNQKKYLGKFPSHYFLLFFPKKNCMTCDVGASHEGGSCPWLGSLYNRSLQTTLQDCKYGELYGNHVQLVLEISDLWYCRCKGWSRTRCKRLNNS